METKQKTTLSSSSRWNPIRVFATGLAMLLALLTLLSFFPSQNRFFDLIANLRIQGLIAILVTGVVSQVLRQRMVVFGLIALFMVNAWSSRLAFTDGESRAKLAGQLRITSLNVFSGNSNYEAVAEELRRVNADVMVIVELTPGLAEHLQNQFADSHPYHTLELDGGGSFGIGVLSNQPLSNIERLRWAGCPASLTMNVADFRLVATHPYPPISKQGFGGRNVQLDNLSEQIAEYSREEPDQGIICVGDFNLTPWSAIMRDFQRRTDLRRAGVGMEISPTWFVRDTFALGLCIDHVLISATLMCSDFAVGQDCGSDHRGVTATIGRR